MSVEQLPPYTTVLVATDGSDTAQEAVRHATGISRGLGATLHLVAVGKPGRVSESATADAPDDISHLLGPRPEVEAMLESVARVVRSCGVEAVCHAELDRSPTDGILRVADAVRADLLVVGNRGLGGLRGMLGSVPSAVSHRASCTVAIVHTT